MVNNIQGCKAAVEATINVGLLYYSHIPVMVVALLTGFFVYFKNKQNLSAKVLFFLSLAFSIWAALDLVAWVSFDSVHIMFTWSLLGIFDALIYILSFYFIYVFINKKDMPFLYKLFFVLLIAPIMLLTPTRYNLSEFDVINCWAVDQSFRGYLYIPEILISVCILVYSIVSLVRYKKEFRKQILLITIGIVFFLISFFSAGYLSDMFGDYAYDVYGLFSMAIFIGFLAYLIVQYKAFNIKLLGAQVLVVGLVALIFSEFFFTGIQDVTVTILISVTVLLSTVFGIWLINSVKNEVKRKDDLQAMSDQLAAANDELRKLDNAKSEFISIASHQLRTPLTAIKGFISLILEGTYGEVSAGVHDALNKVYLSNERIIGLVENLLTVSRIESGRIEYKFEPTRIENIINELNDIFIMIAKQKNIALNILLPKDPLPEVEMDGQKIRELVSNLVDNALKYSNEGGVTVRAERISNFQFPISNKIQNSNDKNQNEGDAIRITVSDTGIGIPADEIPYLFAKFSRGKDINRLHAGGTGLGLYVAKNIVEAHHGKIWVESDGAGKGSRFIMELPVKHLG